MLETIIRLTSSYRNINEIVDDNSNCYMIIMMNAMRMNHSYSGDDSYVNEKKQMKMPMNHYRMNAKS